MGCMSSKKNNKIVDDSLLRSVQVVGPDWRETITIVNESSMEVLVFVVEDPNALRLKKKTVTSDGSASLNAGAYGVGVGVEAKKGSTVEWEAEGNSADVQKIRIKSKNDTVVYVDGTSFIAVLFYRDNLYHFAIESRQLPKRGKFTIRNDHLESQIPFPTSAEEPNYGSKMERGSGSFAQRNESVEQ